MTDENRRNTLCPAISSCYRGIFYVGLPVTLYCPLKGVSVKKVPNGTNALPAEVPRLKHYHQYCQVLLCFSAVLLFGYPAFCFFTQQAFSWLPVLHGSYLGTIGSLGKEVAQEPGHFPRSNGGKGILNILDSKEDMLNGLFFFWCAGLPWFVLFVGDNRSSAVITLVTVVAVLELIQIALLRYYYRWIRQHLLD